MDMFKEPYRIFFPVGILCFLVGILLWIPQIWGAGSYPVILHRYLLLNGFTAAFVGGFLMTAVPKFSDTFPARKFEVLSYLAITLIGMIAATIEHEQCVMIFSGLQPLVLLFFLFSRIFQRNQNPPYSFIFIFVGLFLWAISAFHGALIDPETLKRLHYEGAIASIILGVGSRLIPGILGHVEIVKKQRARYERPLPFHKTIPLHFVFIIMVFVASYFMNEEIANWLRAIIVSVVGIFYWKLYSIPKEKTSLTWSIWVTAWMIVVSFLLRAAWDDGMIHASHAFFINGIALLSFLIATRVLQSHGPQDKKYENKKVLYLITFLFILAAATRVSAHMMPELYLSHLGYSSIVLALGAIIWGQQYLKLVMVFPKGRL